MGLVERWLGCYPFIFLLSNWEDVVSRYGERNRSGNYQQKISKVKF